MKGAIRKNLLTERIDIVKPLGWYRDSPTLTDVDVKYLLLYFEENYGLLKGAIRKNLLTERIDIVKPLGWYRDSPTLTDVDVKYLLLYFEENYGLTVEKKIIDAVAVIANENRYHPVCDFLNALQWDGTERIRFCLHRFLGSDTDDYTYEALKLFLLGAISRAFKPGCKFEVMLCLLGGQGAGKSSFFRLLAVNDDWFSDDLKEKAG